MKKGAKCVTKFCRKARASNSSYCHACAKRRYREANPVKAAFQNLRASAKRRGKAFELTFEEFERFCFESDYIAGKGRHKHGYTVDRIDPERGYTLDNIQVLTNSENASKHRRYLRMHWGVSGGPEFTTEAERREDDGDSDLPF